MAVGSVRRGVRGTRSSYVKLYIGRVHPRTPDVNSVRDALAFGGDESRDPVTARV
jgi:hypothetical protein